MVEKDGNLLRILLDLKSKKWKKNRILEKVEVINKQEDKK